MYQNFMNFDNAKICDFDLHGIVGIRLVNPTQHEITAVTKQVGPIQTNLEREPDIVIKFVDFLPTNGTVRYLGLNQAAYTDDAFLVLKSKHSPAMVQIPFDQVGTERCEIICEKGLPRVPHLIAIINLTMLSKGILPMHSSAFRYNDQGILATGWAKGGKTESLLAFMNHGAEYVGDEWLYISEDGSTMYGIPEPIRFWDWQIQDLPKFWDKVKAKDRFVLKGLQAVTNSVDQLSSNSVVKKTPPGKIMQRVNPMLKKQQWVQVPPQKIFGGGYGPLTSSLDKVFFVASHASPKTEVKEVDPAEIAERMVYSLQDERADFMNVYHTFRFAFPERKNDLIDNTEAIERKALHKVLANKPCYTAFHPYPVAIPDLYEAMKPFV